MNHSLKPFAQIFCVILASFLLAACAGRLAGTSSPNRALSPVEAADQAAAQSDYAQAADLYLQAAQQAANADSRQRLRLEAGLAAAHAGRVQMARQILSKFQPSTLGALDRERYELARTEVQIADLTPGEALTRLPPPSRGTPPEIAELVFQKRATIYFAQNDIIQGIHNLVQRDVWLTEPRAQRSNDNTIYDKALDAIAFGQGPDSRVARDADSTTRGWLALAAIGQRRWASRADRDQALADWEQQYRGHPAARHILEERFNYARTIDPAQRQTGESGQQRGPAPRPTSDTVALALPLSGNFSSAAGAIRDGFMFAYNNDSTAPARPLVYDTSTMSAGDILDQARRDNIGTLVGPLQKSSVSNIARRDSQILNIALNYTDGQSNRPGFYQFALSPEDEAKAAARHALDQGYTRALALVPQGDWGDRVIDAFREQINSEGGTLVDYATYDDNRPDHRQTIQSVLRGYEQGGDIDFIFVAAQPDQGRQIRSQLRYVGATQLPMLSTSHIYTGTPDASSDIDLNGVRFVDLPWVVGDGGTLASRRNQAEQRFGDAAKSYKRLFAMGMDAWLLADRIVSGGLSTGDTFEGMTGVLAVTPDGSIRRYLATAVFRNGEPRLLDMPTLRDVDIESSRTSPWPQR